MKTIFFTVADDNHAKYAKMLENSLRKFHKDVDFEVFGEKHRFDNKMEPQKYYYIATPLIASELFKKGYEQVIKIDADSIITGNLNHILSNPFFDVGVVFNWNRVDPKTYGEIGLLTIQPKEYYNNGFVVMRNRDFAFDWLKSCNTYHFDRMPMREQGFLNLIAHYGGHYHVQILDGKFWHGLISKGEWNKCIMRDNEMILPKGEDHYPNDDVTIKVIHWGGGTGGVKMNYGIYFKDDCIKYLDWLTSETDKTFDEYKKEEHGNGK